MNLQEQVSRQRVKYIVSSYSLDGEDPKPFATFLDEMIQTYATPLIELALVETLVDSWLSVPMVRGVAFLSQAQEKLRSWDNHPIVSTITPVQFQQIAGLDPSPVFGSAEIPPVRSIVQPS
jgi:hypothetical protein